MKLIKKICKLTSILVKERLWYGTNYDVAYVVEEADWCVKNDAMNVAKNSTEMLIRITTSHLFVKKKIIHFASINTFMTETKIANVHKSNKVIVTWFHIAPDDSRIHLIKEADKRVDIWHTSCTITRDKLIQLGIKPEKIVIVPLGINPEIYHEINPKEREDMRKKLGITDRQIAIGSFQKDGIGWDEGNDPKYVKGPDIFCDVIERLSKSFDIFVVLTGPARGYVKNRLKMAGVPFHHEYLEQPDDVASFYNALDLYIISSREEGGPKAVAESLASGIPLISTNVGMAADFLIDGENGLIAEINNVDELVEKSVAMLNDVTLRERCIKNGFITASNLTYRRMAYEFCELLYTKL